jgi:hypothetical protein
MSRVWQNSEASLKIDKMSTLRKKIAEALEEDSLDLREISKLFGIKEKKSLIISYILKSQYITGALLWSQPLVNNVVFLSKSGLA